jgi:hypothetical protein
MVSRSPTYMLPAIVVGGSILAGSWIVTTSLDKTTSVLDQVRASLVETKGALEEVAKARPAAAPSKRRGPDPNKRYEVAIDGAPTKGPKSARVKIVEFSDFQ